MAQNPSEISSTKELPAAVHPASPHILPAELTQRTSSTLAAPKERTTIQDLRDLLNKMPDAYSKPLNMVSDRPAHIKDDLSKSPMFHPDEVNNHKVFDAVEKYGDKLDYRQKGQLENIIDNTLNGKLKDTSSELAKDPAVRASYEKFLKNDLGAKTALKENGSGSYELSAELPGSPGSKLVFASHGGLTEAYAMHDGKKVTDESTLTQDLAKVTEKGKQSYMEPSMLR